MLLAGASGVQMATRFVCTEECDVSPKFKQAYLDAKEEDITIINSPVGLLGRAIRNKFLRELDIQGKIITKDWSLYDSSHITFDPKNFSASELNDHYWQTYQEFYSFKNIIKHVFQDIPISNYPVRDFFKNLFYQFYFRGKAYSFDQHP